MFKLLDCFNVLFWSCAYLLMVISGWKRENELFMPLICGGICWAWELNALMETGLWGHVLWFALDTAILVHNIRYLSGYKRFAYIGYVFLLTVLMHAVFGLANGMLYSSWLLDVAIGIEYLTLAKKISVHNRALIGVFRLLGDLGAYMAYMNDPLVAVCGAISLLLDVAFLAWHLEQASGSMSKQKRR